MKISFTKYQGTGNDFIIVDDRPLKFPNDLKVVRQLCHRKFGIGADGLILIRSHADYDFEMVYFNADGSQSMCGNGSRCAAHFAHLLGVAGRQTTFLAIDGPHNAQIDGDMVSVQLSDVEKIETAPGGVFINTGSPHHVAFVEDLDSYPVIERGRAIRYSDTYSPKGTNVNFVELEGNNSIYVRTYERGVEDETLSCGTGVTACSMAATTKSYQSPVSVRTPGGTLQVSFKTEKEGFKEVFLKGPATPVFTGQIEV